MSNLIHETFMFSRIDLALHRCVCVNNHFLVDKIELVLMSLLAYWHLISEVWMLFRGGNELWKGKLFVAMQAWQKLSCHTFLDEVCFHNQISYMYSTLILPFTEEVLVSDELFFLQKLTPTRNFESCPVEIRACRQSGTNWNCRTCQGKRNLEGFGGGREKHTYKPL